MAIPVDYERLGGPRTLPRAERERRVVQNVERLHRRRLIERLDATTAQLAARVAGWRDGYLALARDARRLYRAALLGWGAAILAVVALVVRLATGG